MTDHTPQQIERTLSLTRALLTELATQHRVRVVVQTRSPLVVRDVDVLAQLAGARVNMTITTDSEPIRKAFEPQCPRCANGWTRSAKWRRRGSMLASR
jgi:DNA repair photolyase